MASSKAFTKSLLSFYRFLRRRRRPHAKIHKNPPVDKLSSAKTLVVDVEGGLLRSPSLFPYFLLVSVEAGGLIRGLILLLLYPFLCGMSEETALRVMVMVSFCGLMEEGLKVGRSVLPKFFLEDVGMEGFEVMRKGRRRVCVSRMPRVMVEGFLREYLEAEEVVGRELKVFRGYYTGFMEEEVAESGLKELLLRGGEEEEDGAEIYGFGSYSRSSIHRYLFSFCKEVYMVTEAEKRSWRALPRSAYPRPLVFHDGRLALLPTPSAALFLLLWAPLALPLSILRVAAFALLPYHLAVPLGAFSGLRARIDHQTSPSPSRRRRRHLYVCNHRTLLDPIYISTALSRPLTAVTYSVSRVSELLSPIPTVRLSRSKEDDRRKMSAFLSKGDLVVCPEGTTCREPYLLRFSPLFAELAEEVVPVALTTEVSMVHGTTASGHKWMDPFCFLMNPSPKYEIKFLAPVPTTTGNREDSCGVANRVQGEIGRALGFECTALTRKDKYLMLAGNEGIVVAAAAARSSKRKG